MQVAVGEFKSKCTKILRNVFNTGQIVEITRRGKVVAIVTPPGPDKKSDPEEFLGCLSGTVSYFPGWDEPQLHPVIHDSDNYPFRLSVISAWEVAKKISIGKLSLSVPVRDWLTKATRKPFIDILPLTVCFF